jgi:putative membrane protein
MADLSPMTDADRERVSAAVSAAESRSAGEIVTILAERSDDYGDVALVWSAAVGLLALLALALLPDFYLGIYERLTGGWVHEWTPRRVFAVAAFVVSLKFAGMWLILLWRPLRLWLTPAAIRHRRVRARAITCFKVGAERRTHGRTGILIYLSLAEHRAEIVADEAIATKVPAEVWGDAMAAMLAELKRDRLADGLIAAVDKVGAVLAQHFPRAEDDHNELPDRLIEV